jgi:adenosylcobinamide kinase/adenosylcobinamide-phosphate guanylyltransferase
MPETCGIDGCEWFTNEVGCGIVPDNELARLYRDLAGEMNQGIASVSSEVYWMVFGMPLTVKKGMKS